MKSVFEPLTRQELITRINSLTPQHTAQWGKMNVFQMAKHCTHAEEMYHGTLKIKRVFIGRLIGKMVLKKFIKDEKQLSKNSPTAAVLNTKDTSGNLEIQKKEWIRRIEQFGEFNNSNFIHPFFGPMTKEEIGVFAYKHDDHHLRQFGA